MMKYTNKKLKLSGYKVIRMWEHEIFNNLENEV